VAFAASFIVPSLGPKRSAENASEQTSAAAVPGEHGALPADVSGPA